MPLLQQSNFALLPVLSKYIHLAIAVGSGPSGPSIEGPFCRAVHLCRALEDRKMEKKRKKKERK